MSPHAQPVAGIHPVYDSAAIDALAEELKNGRPIDSTAAAIDALATRHRGGEPLDPLAAAIEQEAARLLAEEARGRPERPVTIPLPSGGREFRAPSEYDRKLHDHQMQMLGEQLNRAKAALAEAEGAKVKTNIEQLNAEAKDTKSEAQALKVGYASDPVRADEQLANWQEQWGQEFKRLSAQRTYKGEQEFARSQKKDAELAIRLTPGGNKYGGEKRKQLRTEIAQKWGTAAETWEEAAKPIPPELADVCREVLAEISSVQNHIAADKKLVAELLQKQRRQPPRYGVVRADTPALGPGPAPRIPTRRSPRQ